MGSEKRTNQPVFTQSLFTTVHSPSSSWRSHLTSTIFHALLILALLLVTVPAIREAKRRQIEHATLVAPVVPEFRPKTSTVLPTPPAPSQAKIVAPRRNENVPVPHKLVELKPVPAPPKERVEIAAAPEIRDTPQTPAKILPDLREHPGPPKPQVKMGAFETANAARAQTAPRVAQVGGFGDTHGVPATAADHPPAVTMARVGSFDLPEGGGRTGGGGRAASGGVRQTAFGEGGPAPASQAAATRQVQQTSFGEGSATGQADRQGSRSAIQTGGFGDSSAPSPSERVATQKKPVTPATTPVEILSKPKPQYTDEARNLKLEGQVSLNVVFKSDGSMQIVKVVQGLGHGLDEAAERAASQVRFRPATRGGLPVDSSATIHITFQLT